MIYKTKLEKATNSLKIDKFTDYRESWAQSDLSPSGLEAC